MKCQKIVKNAHHNLPEHKVTYLDGLVHPTNIPQLKYSSFTIINGKEKQQILTF